MSSARQTRSMGTVTRGKSRSASVHNDEADKQADAECSPVSKSNDSDSNQDANNNSNVAQSNQP